VKQEFIAVWEIKAKKYINLEEDEYEHLCVHKQRWPNKNEDETMW
jgi:hypothetical protein